MRKIVAVIGDGTVREENAIYALAREVGTQVIDAGFRVMTGGLGGVMEAACRGAHESKKYREGDTIGILPGNDTKNANQWVDIAIPTGLDHLRNGICAHGDALIAVGGGAGTLAEIAFGWIYERPIVALGNEGWSHTLAGKAVDSRRGNITIARATSAKEAALLVLTALAE